MPTRYREWGEAHVLTPERPHDAEESSPPSHSTPHPTSPPGARPPRARETRRRALLVAVAATLLAAIVLTIMIADAKPQTGTQGRAKSGATATPLPTKTATATVPTTATPSPTPQAGFRWYVDTDERFAIQYPITWAFQPANPGVEFDDSVTNPGYTAQVLSSGSASGFGPQGKADDASAWVEYELGVLAKQEQSDYHEAPGPGTTVTIAGQQWRSGVAQLTSPNQTQPPLRVQVYATIYQGKPYIINLLTADSQFANATDIYFAPMLKSFQFLPRQGQ